jgi:phosphoribosyl-AMP cyclohydrolase
MKGLQDVRWDADGRVPVVVQDASSGAVLALDTMDRAGLATTFATGLATYWLPGDGTAGGCAAAGPLQMLTAAFLACDGRAILLQVQAAGPVCRQNATGSCFGEVLSLEASPSQGGRPESRANRAADEVMIRWSPQAAEGA